MASGKIELFHGDCLEVMKTLPDQSVDLCVTSPPYDDLRDYGGKVIWNFEVFKPIAQQLKRLLTAGGIIVWIVNDATKGGDESGSSFKQALYFKEIGLKLHDTMIWKKISPFHHKNRYLQSFEYMFILSNGYRKTANLISDRKNRYSGVRIHGTERQKDGKTKPLSEKQKSKTVKDFGVRLNVWDISGEKANKTGHPAVFPVTLAQDHILSWSNEGATVLDPFMGSGSTGVACKNLNRNFIGIELEKTYFDIAQGRISQA